jgi:hypothetical protein
MIAHLAKHGMLCFTLVENVWGTVQWIGAVPPIFMRILLVFQSEIPEFLWGIDKLLGQFFCLGASRRRAFLKGVRRVHVSLPLVPPPLSAIGLGDLRSHLTPGIRNNSKADFTDNQWNNLADLEAQLKAAVTTGKIPPNSVAVVSPDRAQGKVYKATYTVNIAPCLTCNNHYLMVLSTHDLHKSTAEREFFRFFSAAERFTLQGLEKNIPATIPANLRTKAAGNAYPPPLILAEVTPILMSIAMTGGLPDISSVKPSSSYEDFHVLMRQMGEKLRAESDNPIFVPMRPAGLKKKRVHTDTPNAPGKAMKAMKAKKSPKKPSWGSSCNFGGNW